MQIDTKSPAYQRFQSLKTFRDLNNLVEDAAVEDLYLECKDQSSPTQISRPVLAKTISGFSNTTGGVILWGAHTDKKNGKDVITEILPIGNIDSFKARIESLLLTLTMPAARDFELRVIRQKKSDGRGNLVGYIPPRPNQPTQSLSDNLFYIRGQDDFSVAPYEFIQRLFAAQTSPDISASIFETLTKYDSDKDEFHMSVGLRNESVAVGREVVCIVRFLDGKSENEVSVRQGFHDVSKYNVGAKVFKASLSGVLHKELAHVLGSLSLKPAKGSRSIDAQMSVYADKMTAKFFTYRLTLSKSNPKSHLLEEGFMY